jgi:hypothetical protein
MKTFHHGGRIGDCVYALWTMKALGGGKLILTDYHHPNWDLTIARSMERFLRYQPYVHDVEFLPYHEVKRHFAKRLDRSNDYTSADVDYDLRAAEDDYNPEKFPEWIGPDWPGNCHIAKRYATHFGLEFDGKPWLTAPLLPSVPFYDIVVHLPAYRLVRSVEDWIELIEILTEDYECLFLDSSSNRNGRDLLDTATSINSSQIFLGAVSSCHAIAEGLGKPRLVEQAPGCFNVTPTLSLNGMSNGDVVKEVWKYL